MVIYVYISNLLNIYKTEVFGDTEFKDSLNGVRHFYSNSELFDYSQNLHVGQKPYNKYFKKRKRKN